MSLVGEEVGEKEFVLDDEKYFTFSNSNISGNEGFYSSDLS